MATKVYETRDSIANVYGQRTPYKHEWPTRCDVRTLEEPEKWVQSACVLCSNGCGLDIGVKNGKVVGVRGRITDRVNRGRLGPKGLHGWESMNHPDRLKQPLIRRNGQLESASWDEAMSLIVDKTKDVQKRLTNHGIGFYTTGQLFLEEYYVLAMIGKAGLNTLHMDGNTRLCTATAAASMRESFGSDGQPGSYTDIDFTNCIFMVGHNMANTQTVLWSRVLDRLAGPDPPKLVVVDPRESETARHATVHLAPKGGTNVALLNGLQHLIFKNGWVNEEWVEQHTVGRQELEKTVAKYTPEYVENITGVPANMLKEAAEIIGTSGSLLSTALQGVYQSNQATAAACQINNINLLLGHIGKPGSGILQMNGQPTAQNNRETGCDGEYPGFRNFQNEKHMKEIADIWKIDLVHTPHWNEPTHIQNMLNYIEDGTIQMFWVSGTNPLVSLPSLPELFLVVQDIFMTETAAIADVVLPAAQWGEKTGCFTNVDRTMHLSMKAVDPPGEARADLDIWLDYAKRMEFKNKYGEPLIPFTSPKEVFDEWRKMSFGRPLDCSQLTYEKLTGGSGIQWPCTKEHPYGKDRLFDDGKFFTDTDYCESYGHDLETGTPYTRAQYQAMNPAGRAILKSAHYKPSLETPDEDYPLLLSTGRNVFHFHTRTKTGRARRLQQADPEPIVQISVEDAEALHVTEGEMVVVRSRRGSVELPVRIGGINEGHVFIPFHFGYWDATDGRARAANELTIEQWDPVSKQPMFKSGAVRIEKCVQQEEERQTMALRSVEQKKPDAASSAGDNSKDKKLIRRLELWLGATDQALEMLRDMYVDMIPRLVHDMEIQGGLQVMRRITCEVLDQFKPIIERYHESQQYGRRVAERLRDSIFPAIGESNDPYEALAALQSLDLFLTYIEGHLTALSPASQALWDCDFIDAVKFAQKGIQRQKGWVSQHIKVKSPQTLLVPSAAPEELSGEDSRMAGQIRC
ncbi:molybdopterin oxidoreductase family protein [Aspergillus fischeri NRRL 181]|uniref:Nitrate reductase n=1 Tax=Neosartorya fischeri (strain ATCC 1020 / DSM 3700 / CBS 544.65 / FGSC A1164 / JCM 1740 / NRRL 181 / WB 181) TaxID=331117 RepID=A1D5N5_NEOFI|nr:nitrate reductase [Aspergillus fischeri NRRL 181]EAW21029.1 nitrate reductase [Aspergillus fischeri NRRL 181]